MALRAFGTVRLTRVSSLCAMPRFQPGMAAMYARTGASPSPFLICGFWPARSLGFAARFALDLAGRLLVADAFERLDLEAVVFARGRLAGLLLLGMVSG